MKVIIDRFERNFAVCEKADRTMINIERRCLPKDVEEGDILIIGDNGITISAAEPVVYKSRIKKLMKDVWE